MEVSSRGHSSKVKKDEASSKDAELWKELLLKAQKGTTTEPYFIAKVGQSSLHTNVFCKIVLPAMFLDHHHKRLKEKIILEDSFEHRWPAMLSLTWQSKPCILHGWKEFAEDHNLQIGDQVVFFLVAKSHFMVQVFDADNNAKRRTPVIDQYNNPNISVPKGKTNKFSKSIENDEETSATTKCNLNLQPKGLRETGATNDKSDAKNTFASVKVKIEGEAPDRSRLKPAETNLGPSSLGNIYTRCLTADGHEFFNILDTSEEEECEKVTLNSKRRRTAPRVKSPQASGERKSFEVQTTTNSEKSEEGHLNVKIRKVDLAEDVALDGSLRHPPSKFHHPKHPKVPSEIAETRPILGNDNIMDRLLGKDTQKRTSSSEIKSSEHPVLENDSIMNRLLGIDTQKRSPSPENSSFQHPVLENDSIMNRLLGKDIQKRSPSPEETISEHPVLKNDSIMNRLLGKDIQKRSPSPEERITEHPVLENDSIMNRLLGKDIQKRSPSPEKTISEHPVLENDSIMNRLLGKDTQKRSPSPEKKSFEHPVLENDNIMNRLVGKDTQKRSPPPVNTPSEQPVLEIDSIMNTLLGREPQKKRPSPEITPSVLEHPVLETDSIINRLLGTCATAQAPADIAPVSSKMGNIHQQQKKPQKEKTTAELPNMGKKEPPRRSPPPPEDTPSSPEQALTLKRSRKLQRKSGGNYEGNEKFKAEARLARLERLLKLSQDRQIEMRGSTTSNSGSTQCKEGECNCKQKSRETMKDHLRRSASKDLRGGDSFLFSHCEQDVQRKKKETLQRMEHLFRKKIKETKGESRDGEVTCVKHLFRDDAQPVLEKVKERHHHVFVNEDVVTKGTKREGATTTREVSLDRLSGEKTLLTKDNWVSRKKVFLPEVPKELVIQQPLVRRDDQNTSTTVKSKLLEPRDHKETSASELSQRPGGLEGRLPVKSRHKVMMGSKDNKSCKSPITDPITPNPIPSPSLQAKPVYKRPPRKVRAPKNPPLLYISKRRPITAEEREDALAQANAYAQKVTNQKFVMQLKTNQVYCGFHLKVPQEFVDALQMPSRTMNMTLCDFTGKTWEVEWLSDEPGRYGFRSAGWTRFVLEHFLEEGDVCVFDLPDPQHFHILVHIFPVVELVEIAPNGWQSHYSLAADIPNSNEVLKRPL